MTYTTSAKLYRGRFVQGRQYKRKASEIIFPFNEDRYRDEEFVELMVPVSWLYHSVVSCEAVKKYKDMIARGITLHPIWISAGRKLADGSINLWHNRELRIFDGAHRWEAHKELGKEFIKAIMPESHIKAYGLDS